jgi:hypothetical protein
MKKEYKDFILDLRDRMITSNIKDACLNFMQGHPQMFNDTTNGDRKIMNIAMSVCICVDDEKNIALDPGFITIDIGIKNGYSEHFGSGNRYWNNDLEEENNDEQNM